MSEFERCIKRRGLVRTDGMGPDAVEREMASTHEDLADIVIMLEHSQWKRVTITAYYAMFHAARGLLLRHGLAEKSHFCLGVAFRHLAGDSEQGRALASGLERARVLREEADYRSVFDEEGARAAAMVAERFVSFVMHRLSTGPDEQV